MQFKFETAGVYMAMERFIDEYKDNVDAVGWADYDHIFSIYETLTRTVIKPEFVLLDHSELNLLEEWM